MTPALHIIAERSDRSILLGHSLSLFLDIKALSLGLGAVIKLETLEYDHSVKDQGRMRKLHIRTAACDPKRIDE